MRRRILVQPTTIFLFLVAAADFYIKSIVWSLTMNATRTRLIPKPPRVELFFSSNEDLRNRVQFLHDKGVTAFNLVNKHRSDPLLEWVDIVKQVCPGADVCVHYSLKYNKVPRKGLEEHAQLWQDFLNSSKDTAKEVLLVSGNQKDKAIWNTLAALDYLPKVLGGSLIAVAYNPYFPDAADQQVENQRLEQKLASGKVSKIYLQFGSDLLKLKTGLEYLVSLQQKSDGATCAAPRSSFHIAGSLFLPTKRLIAQQKFRPWNGVFLSADFLEGPETASAIMIEMIKIYQTHNVELLWEAPGIRNDKDWLEVQTLMKQLGGNHHVATSESVTEVVVDNQQQDPPHPYENQSPAILLFGSHDVRLRDNRAVEQALHNHQVVIPVFLCTSKSQWGVRGALEVALQDALESLDASLRQHGLRLICRNCESTKGSIEELENILSETGAGSVYWNKEHTPEGRELEQHRAEALKRMKIQAYCLQSSLLYDPEQISLSKGFHGGHWGTLMPFLKNCKKHHGGPPPPTPSHETFRLLENAQAPKMWPSSVSVAELPLAIVRGKDTWDLPIRQRFPMSEEAAQACMDIFFRRGLARYEKERSRADREFATSKLSAHLRVGTLSPNQLYWRIENSHLTETELKTFSRRLFWRELAYYQLFCFPNMRTMPIREHYQNMEWVTGEEEDRRFQAWKKGKTGYPIVDAGMRELYATGWMTQSIRMVTASFLVDYLRVSWIKGCEWFHYTLVDADSAINAMMWQNAGKSGIDQWNFILSPVSASQDPTGDYTRQWIPELSELPTKKLLHQPWTASEEVLEYHGVILGETYPVRIIQDLQSERQLGIKSILEMRRRSQHRNSERGYDLIRLPSGDDTVVFTKKEYRIDESGQLLIDSRQPKSRATSGGRKRKIVFTTSKR